MSRRFRLSRPHAGASAPEPGSGAEQPWQDVELAATGELEAPEPPEAPEAAEAAPRELGFGLSYSAGIAMRLKFNSFNHSPAFDIQAGNNTLG